MIGAVESYCFSVAITFEAVQVNPLILLWRCLASV